MPNYSAADRARAINAVARTIMGEAAGESYEGKLAVGNTIMNRAAINFSGYGTDPAAQALAPKQFSAWNGVAEGGNKLVNSKAGKAYRDAVKAATAVVDGTVPDNTLGSTYYNTGDSSLASKSTKARMAYGDANPNVKIGAHTFYNYKDAPEDLATIGNRFMNPASPTFNPAMSPAQAAIDNSSAPLAPQTPSERMWGAVQSVLGAPVTAAMRAGQIGVDIGVGLADQAARIAQNSAQQQPNNPAADSPANRMRSAVGLPTHPSTPTPASAASGQLGPAQTAPVGAVTQGPSLTAPAARMHDAISQQYGGPMAAADAAKAQGISYSPNFDQTFADASSTMQQAAKPAAHPSTPTPATARAPTVTTPLGMNTAPATDIGDFSLSANGDIAPSAGLSPQARMDENNLNAQIAAASVGPAPGAVTGKKPGELGYTAPAPVAPPVAAPVAPPPQPRPVAVAPAKPRTIQSVQPALPPAPAPPAGLQTAVAKARPGTSLFDAISQNNLGAAPDGTRWGVGLTGKPVAVPTSAPEGVQIAASGTGLLGALGLTSPQQAAPQQSSGFFSGLTNAIGNLFSGSSNGGGYSTASGYGRQVQSNASNLASLVAANPYLSGGGGGISMGGGYRTSNDGGNLHG
jgi:hypothetical protein